jgi:hypothetical protein
MLTEEEVKAALPPALRSSVSASLMKTLQDIAADPDSADAIRENFITYSHVLKEGKYKVTDYVNAVRYVSFKNMGLTNQDAYAKTFPDRYKNLIGRGASPKEISAYVSLYHRGKLVNSIMDQTMIPVHVLFHDVFCQAVMTQAHLMVSAQSEMVRVTAANSVLTHLAKPKEMVAKISMDVGESKVVEDLFAQMGKLAKMQQDLMKDGVGTKVIAGMPIIDVEAKNVTAP